MKRNFSDFTQYPEITSNFNLFYTCKENSTNKVWASVSELSRIFKLNESEFCRHFSSIIDTKDNVNIIELESFIPIIKRFNEVVQDEERSLKYTKLDCSNKKLTGSKEITTQEKSPKDNE